MPAPPRPWRALLIALAATALVLTTTPGNATLASAPATAATPDDGKAGDKAGRKGKKKDPVWRGTPGTNLAHESYGYPWPAAPDCNESNVADGSCVNDGLGFFQGQCTSWVAHRVSQRNGISFSNWFGGVRWGNAADWAKVAKGLGYERNRVPAEGAIGWYRRGHVSYIEAVNPDGSVVVSEMNTDGHNGFHLTTTYPGAAGYPDKFIHVADVVPVDYTAPAAPPALRAEHLERGVALSWKPSVDDTGVTGYRILRDGVPLAETTRPGFVDRRASRGQVYRYRVVAEDAAGNVSEPAQDLLGQSVPVTGRQRGPLREATEVRTASGSAVCGLLGSQRREHVACRVRTLSGWEVVRTGRPVPWGTAGTRAFVGSATDERVWFCRALPGGRHGCLPLDLTTLSWGFDRVDRPRSTPDNPVWKATPTGPARCGYVGDRPSCAVLAEAGWKRLQRAEDARSGDPLSRAFVPAAEGVAFCRVLDGRGACTTLDTRRLRWTRTVRTERTVDLGRWTGRRAGPTLCVVGGACRVVSRPVAEVRAPSPRRSRLLSP